MIVMDWEHPRSDGRRDSFYVDGGSRMLPLFVLQCRFYTPVYTILMDLHYY